MSDDQNPRRGVFFYKHVIRLWCCKLVGHFAWEAQESASAGAIYIYVTIYLYIYLVIYIIINIYIYV